MKICLNINWKIYTKPCPHICLKLPQDIKTYSYTCLKIHKKVRLNLSQDLKSVHPSQLTKRNLKKWRWKQQIISRKYLI